MLEESLLKVVLSDAQKSGSQDEVQYINMRVFLNHRHGACGRVSESKSLMMIVRDFERLETHLFRR